MVGKREGGCCSGQRGPLCRHKDLTREAPAGAGPNEWIEKPHGDWGAAGSCLPASPWPCMGEVACRNEETGPGGENRLSQKFTQPQAQAPRANHPGLPSFSWATCQLQEFPTPTPHTPGVNITVQVPHRAEHVWDMRVEPELQSKGCGYFARPGLHI